MTKTASADVSASTSLNDLYLKRLHQFDRAAVRHKRGYLPVSLSATVLTWATLLLAIIAMAWPLPVQTEYLLLFWIIPALGALVLLATLVQTLFGLQGRWLKYRAAAERLRGACMLYRAGVEPFAGADAEQTFREQIEDIMTIVKTGKGKHFVERYDWRYLLGLFQMPAELRPHLPHTPDEGIEPRFGDDVKRDEELVLEGRLRNQQHWHLRKARGYFWKYLAFQTAIMLISLFNMVYAHLQGRTFSVIAFTTAGTLMLFALRDFLDYGPLFLRYVKVAGNLKEIEEAYTNRQEPFDKGDEQERLRLLVENIEQTLTSEFQYWYARH